MSDYLPTHTVVNTLHQLQTPLSTHAPRILLLYGSLREESYSRKAVLEAQKILNSFGADTRVFNPTDLPVFDRINYQHAKVQALHELAMWSEGMVWCSPEQHGNLTAVMKNQID